MRGKSIDTEFVAGFVQECTGLNKFLPEEICEEALRRIEEIDKQLKLRLKFADVLCFFNHKKKNSTVEEEVLSFDDVDLSISKDIIDIIKSNGCVKVVDIINNFSSNDDLYKKNLTFTLKQMLDKRIIYRNYSGIISLGQNFKFFNESKIQ